MNRIFPNISKLENNKQKHILSFLTHFLINLIYIKYNNIYFKIIIVIFDNNIMRKEKFFKFNRLLFNVGNKFQITY